MDMDMIAKLGDSVEVTSNIVSGLASFTCALYGMQNLTNVDDVRYAMFQQKYAPKYDNDPLDKIKGINPSSMPPCHSVLINKIRRTNYVTTLWKKARLPRPCELKAEDHGWKLNASVYRINWFDSEQLPQNIIEILNDDTHEEEEYINYESSEDSETE